MQRPVSPYQLRGLSRKAREENTEEGKQTKNMGGLRGVWIMGGKRRVVETSWEGNQTRLRKKK